MGFAGITSIANNNKQSDIFGDLGNLRNDVFGITDQAKYAQAAALEQQRAQQAVTAEARASRDRLNLAAQSPQQLFALNRGLAAAQEMVDRDLKQLAAIDPAIMEASKQVLSLLKGEQAGVNAPAMEQRNSQRAQLVNMLRSQYGPGAESSGIGQRTLQKFDMETNSMFQQNQMNSLNNVFNVATSRPQVRGIGELYTGAQGYGNMQDRFLNAEQVGSQNILNALGGEVGSAGARFTSDMIRAGGRRQFAEAMEGDARQVGRTWATMGMGGKGGGQAPPQQQQPSGGGGGNSLAQWNQYPGTQYA